MEYDDAAYPHHHEDLPSLPVLLQELDWDVTCIFDACRWDAFETRCAASHPVSSPVTSTAAWTADVWCDETADWSDITYITANPVTTHTSERDEDRYAGHITNHVGEYIDLSDNLFEIWRKEYGTSDPDRVTDYVLSEVDPDPPVVIHYLQPHTPFVGDIGFQVQGNLTDHFEDVAPEHQSQGMRDYYPARVGLLDPDFVRTAYLTNLDLVWEATEPIRSQYDRVITTADHGEQLGPDTWRHGHDELAQARVVPFHTTWDCSTVLNEHSPSPDA